MNQVLACWVKLSIETSQGLLINQYRPKKKISFENVIRKFPSLKWNQGSQTKFIQSYLSLTQPNLSTLTK